MNNKKLTNKQIKDISRLYLSTFVALDNEFDYEGSCDILEEDRSKIRKQISKLTEQLIMGLDIDNYPTTTMDIINFIRNQ